MLDQSSHWMVIRRSFEPLDTGTVVTVYNPVSRMLTLPLHDLESFWFAAWSPASLSSLGLLCLLSQVLFVDFFLPPFSFSLELGRPGFRSQGRMCRFWSHPLTCPHLLFFSLTFVCSLFPFQYFIFMFLTVSSQFFCSFPLLLSLFKTPFSNFYNLYYSFLTSPFQHICSFCC